MQPTTQGKSSLGFTLIELMIVVGIIGILVSIAAPNFTKYQRKARQAEAKLALAGVYTGQKAFYSEYPSYIGYFDAIGYLPEGNKRFYHVAMSSSGAPPAQFLPKFASLRLPLDILARLISMAKLAT